DRRVGAHAVGRAPRGTREAPGRRGHVRPARARLRPDEPDHLPRARHALAPPDRPVARAAARLTRPRPRVRDGRPLPRARRRRLPAARHRLRDPHARPRARAHRRAPRTRRRAGDAAPRRRGRRRRLRVRAPQLRRRPCRVRRVRAHPAPGRPVRGPRRRRPRARRHARRQHRLVSRRGAAPRPDPRARRGGVPLPPPLDGLPPAAERAAGPAARGRLRRRGPAHDDRRVRPAHQRDTRVTGVAALVPDGLRAVTREVGASRAGRAGAGTLLGSLAPGGFAWLQANGGAATGFVTSGEVARVPADEATALLDAIEVDDAVGAPGTGAVAVGALPFDPAAGGELVVPARVFGRAPDGRLWHTEIGPATVAPVVSRVPPTRFDVRAVDTRDGWRAAVEAILAAIDAGTVEKVVLAREVVVEADEDFPVAAVLARLHAQQPGCYVYAAGDLVGASPELLVRRAGAVAESRPMAGTVACDAGDEAVAALAESLKDAREHQFVVDAILAALDGRCESLDVAATPEIARFS